MLSVQLPLLTRLLGQISPSSFEESKVVAVALKNLSLVPEDSPVNTKLRTINQMLKLESFTEVDLAVLMERIALKVIQLEKPIPVFTDRITHLLYELQPNEGLLKNRMHVEGLKNIVDAVPVSSDVDVLYRIQKTFAEAQTKGRSPLELFEFNQVIADKIREKVSELERPKAYYYDLVSTEFDRIEIRSEENFNSLIQGLEKFLANKKRIPENLEPLRDLYKNADSYVIPEDEKEFKQLILSCIQEKKDKLERMSAQEKSDYILEQRERFEAKEKARQEFEARRAAVISKGLKVSNLTLENLNRTLETMPILEEISRFISDGVQPNYESLSLALNNGAPFDVIELLIDAGVEPDENSLEIVLNNEYPEESQIALLTLLIQRGASPSLDLLNLAISLKSSFAVIELLLDNEVIPNRDTLLIAIQSRASYEVIEKLMSHVSSSSRILSAAVESGASSEIMELLRGGH